MKKLKKSNIQKSKTSTKTKVEQPKKRKFSETIYAKRTSETSKLKKPKRASETTFKEKYKGRDIEKDSMGNICIPIPSEKNLKNPLLFSSDHCTKSKCAKEFLGAPLSVGLAGSVYETCVNSGKKCNYVTKVQYAKSPREEEALKEETELATIAGNSGAGPKVKRGFFCDAFKRDTNQKRGKFHFLVMKRFGNTTMRSFRDRYKQSKKDPIFSKKNRLALINLLRDKLNSLLRVNISHTDLHPGNILLEIEGKNINDMAIIDYGSKYVSKIHKRTDFNETKEFYNDIVERYEKMFDI